MTAFISAELFRLRTIRSPRAVAAGVASIVVMIAVGAAWASGIEGAEVPDPIGLMAVGGTMTAIAGALVAAATVGSDFRRGNVALSYLTTPRRGRAFAATIAAYGLAGLALGALASTLAFAVAVPLSDVRQPGQGVSVADAGRVVVGFGLGTGLFAIAGVLLATATRSPTPALLVVLLWQPVETFLTSFGIGEVLPLALLRKILTGETLTAQLTAAAVLALTLGALAALVAVKPLKRDLT